MGYERGNAYDMRRAARYRTERAARMTIAREKGTHTREQWVEVKREFPGVCVRCFKWAGRVEKDHIIPIYDGGSDGIDNLQPLCNRCNVQKGPERYNWLEHRRIHGELAVFT